MNTASRAVVALGWIVAFLSVGAFAGQSGANVYRILKINKQVCNQAVYVDNAWKHSVKTLRVSLKVEEDLGTTVPFCVAYFYDKDKEVVARLGRPNQIEKGDQYEALPSYLKPKTTYDVYFAIPEKVKDWGSRWETVVIVFGDRTRGVAEVYPPANGGLSEFNFDELNLVLGANKKTVFKYTDPAAQGVALAGEFNNWQGEPMTKDASGTWTISLALEPGTHGYKFVVNGGTWILDPATTDRKVIGGVENSAVTVR